MKWRHNKRPRGLGRKATSVYHEFDEQFFDISILVREVFQNLIDAPKVDRGESKPPSVTFKLLSADEDEFDAAYFDEGFSEHPERLRASLGDNYRTVPTKVKNLLVFEEEGFRGLLGPLNDDEDSRDEDRPGHYFRNFFFTQGIKAKRGSSMGRTNKGKITYYAASEYLTVFALTRRHGDNPELALFGKTEFFNDYSIGDEPNRERYFSTSLMHSDGNPSSDESECRGFADAAGLENFDQYGTSWVIPNVDETYLSPENFIPVLLEEFFEPIIGSRLIVNYRGVKISSTTLSDVFGRYPPENLTREQLKFYETCLIMSKIPDEKEFFKIENSNWLPQKGTPNLGLDDSQVQALSKRANNHELLAFKVPINIFPKDRDPKIAELEVFLQKKTNTSKSGAIKFIRSGLIITKEPRGGIPGSSEYEILILATDDLLCDFLANAEDSSHSRFSNNHKIEREYKRSQYESGQTLREVREAAALLVGLFEQSGIRDKNALADLFPSNISDGTEIPPITDSSYKFHINDSSKGEILISCSNEMKEGMNFPIKFSVECKPASSGYSSKYDFDFTQPGKVVSEYPELTDFEATAPNKVDVEFKDPEAKIQLIGLHKRFEIETRIRFNDDGETYA